MTTIVFHNGILAADTRSSNFDHSKANIRSQNDSTLKLVIDYNGTFRNEKVIAITGSGDTITIKAAINMIKSDDIESVFKTAKHLLGSSFKERCTIVIITECNSYMLKICNHDLHIKKYSLTETIVSGSGAVAAKFAVDVFKTDAVIAIMAATLVDDLTGGYVTWIDTLKKPNVLHRKLIDSKEQTLNMFQKKVKYLNRPLKIKKELSCIQKI